MTVQILDKAVDLTDNDLRMIPNFKNHKTEKHSGGQLKRKIWLNPTFLVQIIYILSFPERMISQIHRMIQLRLSKHGHLSLQELIENFSGRDDSDQLLFTTYLYGSISRHTSLNKTISR